MRDPNNVPIQWCCCSPHNKYQHMFLYVSFHFLLKWKETYRKMCCCPFSSYVMFERTSLPKSSFDDFIPAFMQYSLGYLRRDSFLSSLQEAPFEHGTFTALHFLSTNNFLFFSLKTFTYDLTNTFGVILGSFHEEEAPSHHEDPLTTRRRSKALIFSEN